MKLIIFALIPLILSIGITPAFSLQPEDVDTECREGQVLIYRINNLDYICTSQSTASLWANLGIAEIVNSSETKEFPTVESESIPKACTKDYRPVCGVDEKTYGNMCVLESFGVELNHEGECSVSGIETIETRSGIITIDNDYLTPESSKLLDDELFFQRAIQVYHLALPAVGHAGIFYEQDKVGASTGDILYWSDFMTSSS